MGAAEMGDLLQITDSGAPRPTLELRQIAGSACVRDGLLAGSVRCYPNDLGA
jgi:hypothetical protein